MLADLKLMALLAKVNATQNSHISSAKIFNSVLTAGAKCLPSSKPLGKIAAGHLADFILLDSESLLLIPGNDPISDIVYTGCANAVTDLFCHGKHLLDNKTLTTIDETELKTKVRSYMQKVMILD